MRFVSGLGARVRARAREDPTPQRACNQCAGLSGWAPIADAPTCMPCVLRCARATDRRWERERAEVLDAIQHRLTDLSEL